MSDVEDSFEVGEWRRSEPETLLETRVFAVRKHHAASPNDPQRQGEFFYLDAADWVNVIAVTGADQVVLIEQFRHGTGEVTLEIPGGMVDPGEASLDAGLRELREETGYGGSGGHIIGSVAPNPAILNNHCATVLVRDVEKLDAPSFDGYEEIRTRLVDRGEIPELIRRGAINHALVVAAFHHFQLTQQP